MRGDVSVLLRRPERPAAILHIADAGVRPKVSKRCEQAKPAVGDMLMASVSEDEGAGREKFEKAKWWVMRRATYQY